MNSTASGTASIAIGGDGDDGGLAGAQSTGTQTTSVGADAFSSGLNTTALGAGTSATGVQSTAVGAGAGASGVGALSFGAFSQARGNFSTSLGFASFAPALQSTAIGSASQATGENATAIGRAALARAAGATAIGTGTTADFTDSTAVGTGATTTAANQVAIGGTGSAARIGDIEASTLAQQGPVDVVTVDQNGTLGRQEVATAASVQNVRTSVNALAQVSDAQFAQLESRVLGLDSRVNGLEFQLQNVDERLTGGIAASMALGGQMIVPDSNISFSLNASTYQGEQGFAGSVSVRATERIYISAGVAGSTAQDSTGGRVGVAFGF